MGADVNFYDKELFPPLLLAVIINSPRLATCLLQNGTDINAASHGGRTALHCAADNRAMNRNDGKNYQKNLQAMIRLLLEQPNILLDIRSNDGKTAFDLVTYNWLLDWSDNIIEIMKLWQKAK